MTKYKLIKLYPNSPVLGSVIKSTSADYFYVKPHMHLEYWEEMPIVKVGKSFLNEDIMLGETVYVVDNHSLNITPKVTTLNFMNFCDSVYFVNEKDAKKYVDSKISFSLPECGRVEGNVKLYSLLPSNSMQFSTDTAKNIFLKIKKGTELKWKYFLTEEDRISYVTNETKVVSVNDLLNLVESVKNKGIKYEFTDDYYSDVLSSIVDMFLEKATELGGKTIDRNTLVREVPEFEDEGYEHHVGPAE